MGIVGYIFCILLTAATAALTVAFLYERYIRTFLYNRNTEMARNNQCLYDEVNDLRIEIANRDGLTAGHKADTLYRGFLQQFESGNPVTIMYTNRDRAYYTGSR